VVMAGCMWWMGPMIGVFVVDPMIQLTMSNMQVGGWGLGFDLGGWAGEGAAAGGPSMLCASADCIPVLPWRLSASLELDAPTSPQNHLAPVACALAPPSPPRSSPPQPTASTTASTARCARMLA
jgi:hypothetical protein